jgi:hypothetical protein
MCCAPCHPCYMDDEELDSMREKIGAHNCPNDDRMPCCLPGDHYCRDGVDTGKYPCCSPEHPCPNPDYPKNEHGFTRED